MTHTYSAIYLVCQYQVDSFLFFYICIIFFFLNFATAMHTITNYFANSAQNVIFSYQLCIFAKVHIGTLKALKLIHIFISPFEIIYFLLLLEKKLSTLNRIFLPTRINKFICRCDATQFYRINTTKQITHSISFSLKLF
jgi:hypothetical protein